MPRKNPPALPDVQKDMIRKIVSQGDATGLDIAPAKNFSIHRNNARLLIRDLLRDIFPVTQKLVGEAFFDTAARDFLQAFPPATGDLNDYGGDFPAFLARLPGLQPHPYVPDMARLEWLAHEAYLSPRLPAMDTVMLAAAAQDPLTLRLTLQPHIHLLRSGWTIADLWQTVTEGGDTPPEGSLRPQESFTALFRDDRRIAVWTLSEGGYAFLEHLQISPDFARAATAAMQAEDGFALDRFLGLLIQQGLLAK